MKNLTLDFSRDGDDAKVQKFENILDTRYLEIFIINGNTGTNVLQAACYNTIGLNSGDRTGDSAPQGLVDKVDVNAIKAEYHALGAFTNGPRRWCLDWIDIPVGVERDFNGLKAAWVATLNLEGEQRDKIPYKNMTIERKSAFGINKGTTVFLLDDPEGNTWVMKSYSLVLDPAMSREQVPALLARLDLPAGWAYRVKELEQDLTLIPESGVATIVPDNLDNMYDFTGPGCSNYKP